VLHELQPVANRKGIAIQMDCEVVSPVTGDLVLLGQVLRNLLSNAIKYSRQGTAIHITISGAEGAVRMEVADQGQGFEQACAGLLFERFSGHQGAAEISGMGLYLAGKIVRAHNGSIRAESPGLN
jgi:signal transduction histidine kinase